jgi:hypothetical protein
LAEAADATAAAAAVEAAASAAAAAEADTEEEEEEEATAAAAAAGAEEEEPVEAMDGYSDFMLAINGDHWSPEQAIHGNSPSHDARRESRVTIDTALLSSTTSSSPSPVTAEWRRPSSSQVAPTTTTTPPMPGAYPGGGTAGVGRRAGGQQEEQEEERSGHARGPEWQHVGRGTKLAAGGVCSRGGTPECTVATSSGGIGARLTPAERRTLDRMLQDTRPAAVDENAAEALHTAAAAEPAQQRRRLEDSEQALQAFRTQLDRAREAVLTAVHALRSAPSGLPGGLLAGF